MSTPAQREPTPVTVARVPLEAPAGARPPSTSAPDYAAPDPPSPGRYVIERSGPNAVRVSLPPALRPSLPLRGVDYTDNTVEPPRPVTAEEHVTGEWARSDLDPVRSVSGLSFAYRLAVPRNGLVADLYEDPWKLLDEECGPRTWGAAAVWTATEGIAAGDGEPVLEWRDVVGGRVLRSVGKRPPLYLRDTYPGVPPLVPAPVTAEPGYARPGRYGPQGQHAVGTDWRRFRSPGWAQTGLRAGSPVVMLANEQDLRAFPPGEVDYRLADKTHPHAGGGPVRASAVLRWDGAALTGEGYTLGVLRLPMRAVRRGIGYGGQDVPTSWHEQQGSYQERSGGGISGAPPSAGTRWRSWSDPEAWLSVAGAPRTDLFLTGQDTQVRTGHLHEDGWTDSFRGYNFESWQGTPVTGGAVYVPPLSADAFDARAFDLRGTNPDGTPLSVSVQDGTTIYGRRDGQGAQPPRRRGPAGFLTTVQLGERLQPWWQIGGGGDVWPPARAYADGTAGGRFSPSGGGLIDTFENTTGGVALVVVWDGRPTREQVARAQRWVDGTYPLGHVPAAAAARGQLFRTEV